MRAVTEKKQWQPWILYMLDAVEQTADWTRKKIVAVQNLLNHTCDYVKLKLPKIYSRELIDITFTQPYCRIANVVNAQIAQRQTASAYLKQLVDIGILKEKKFGRDVLFLHPKFLNLLTHNKNNFKKYSDG